MTQLRKPVACVDEWLNLVSVDAAHAQLVEIAAAGFAAVSQRARHCLGEIMLDAIVERVVLTGAAQFPPLMAVEIDATGVRFDGLASNRGTADLATLRASLHFLLVELLTVLDSVTGGILTDSLCAELRGVKPRTQSGVATSPSTVLAAAAAKAEPGDNHGG